MQNYSAHFDYAGDFVDRWNRTLRKTRLWMVALAAAMVLVGVASIFAPASMYALIQGIVATVLLIRGGSQVISYAGASELAQNSPLLVTGLLNALLGVMLLVLPGTVTAGAIAFLLAFMLILTGAERISFARRMRYFEISGMRGAMAMGIVNVALGVLFVFSPLFTSMVFAYAVAAYLIVGGISLLVEALTMRRIVRF